nr:RNA-guided endonuclease TnpB family protein [Okeania sp. SIO2B3]
MSFSLEDKSVPSLIPTDNIKTAVGIDVGLKEFLTTNTGETVSVPNFYRKAQSNLARKQSKAARKEIGSNNWQKAQNKIARLHQHIARQREDFHYKTAHKLVKEYDLIAVEDLNIKGLARNTKLSKSIYKESLEQVLILIKQWLLNRGLEISEEKTRIVDIKDGFDFLGFNLRHYKGKLLIKPQKEKVLAFCKKIGKTLAQMKARTQEEVIKTLNPLLRGFANYYRGPGS